jgi:ATP-binding cassette subfamily B protein
MEEEELGTKDFDLALTARLLGYLRPYGAWVGLTFALILIASALQQAGPYLTKVAVDEYILPGDVAGLGGVIALFIGVLVLQFGLGYAQSWLTSMVGQWAMRDVRMALFSRLQRLPLGFFDRTPIGRLMARNTNDVDALNELFTNGVVSMLSELFTVIAILSYIFYMDIELGAITAAALPFAFVATFWLQRQTFTAFREARVRFGRFSASLQETIAGMEVVQLFGCEERRAGLFEEANDGYLKLRMHSTYYHCWYFPFMEFGGAMLTALVLWYGGGQVLREEIEWGVLVAMLQYVPRFFWPIRNIAERFGTFQVAMASSERIFELLDSEAEPRGGDFRAERVRGEIEFRGVWFAYADEDWVLEDVSFVAVPGQAIALVGATGAGKSTIINLIGRFYEIQRGQILVDGVDIHEWDVEALRRRVGVVQQDVFLFAGDVEQNIGLGQEGISREGIEWAAKAVNADGFIRGLADGYCHAVAERGASFSSGQRQLLAFARALAAEPDILVLDEATANIDTETEQLIQAALVELMRGRTSIVVAHRLSTIRKADKILVLHHGRVREEGRHEELLAQGGIYSRLHQLQYKGENGRQEFRAAGDAGGS